MSDIQVVAVEKLMAKIGKIVRSPKRSTFIDFYLLGVCSEFCSLIHSIMRVTELRSKNIYNFQNSNLFALCTIEKEKWMKVHLHQSPCCVSLVRKIFFHFADGRLSQLETQTSQCKRISCSFLSNCLCYLTRLIFTLFPNFS